MHQISLSQINSKVHSYHKSIIKNEIAKFSPPQGFELQLHGSECQCATKKLCWLRHKVPYGHHAKTEIIFYIKWCTVYDLVTRGVTIVAYSTKWSQQFYKCRANHSKIQFMILSFLCRKTCIQLWSWRHTITVSPTDFTPSMNYYNVTQLWGFGEYLLCSELVDYTYSIKPILVCLCLISFHKRLVMACWVRVSYKHHIPRMGIPRIQSWHIFQIRVFHWIASWQQTTTVWTNVCDSYTNFWFPNFWVFLF